MKIRQYKRQIIIIFLCFSIIFLFLLNNIKSINAADLGGDSAWGGDPTSIAGFNSIVTRDPITQKINWKQTLQDWSMFLTKKTWDENQVYLRKLGSYALQQAIQQALREIAYDTATWIGSGGKGQKPLFITEGWGTYLTNVADDAGGKFIETLGKQGAFGQKFNLCEPDLQVKIRIGLGLVQYQRPTPPACTFSKMVKNWQKELQSGDFLNKFQDMFNPSSNDLGIALTLQTNVIEQQNLLKNNQTLERLATRGWLDVTGISGKKESPPGTAESRTQAIQKTLYDYIGQYTGDALADASNVFLNQLAITLFNNMMNKLGANLDTTTHPYSGNYGGLTDYNAAPESGGIAGAKEALRKLVEPNFTTRGDYNILAELSTCPDPNKAGPTNCVIEEKFKQAITNKLTVGEALKQGYLNANGVFGFNSDGLEPKFNEGYPYRSMIILRKFRIIPLGWEVAAQFIKDHPSNIDGTKNLADLVNCFASDDDYSGYSADWCKGLVDPNWVLKAPLNYCKREGPGPEIMSEQVTGEGYDSKRAIVRNDKYCADEQSCIKENNDGSCKLYGYCTEERRKWDFAGASCDPNYNTCETFRGTKGQTISYLQNTLDYNGCNIDNAGCKAYCADYDNASGKFSCTPTTGNKIYLDKNVETCDQANQGCHEFIRLKPGTGANLLTNSSFEDPLAGTIWQGTGTQVNDAYDGTQALQLTGALIKPIAVGPAGYSVRGEIYSLSFYAKNCGLADNFRITGQAQATSLSQGADWQRYETSYIFPTTAAGNQVSFTINSSTCLIDAIKLERNDQTTAYDNYRASGLIYEKLAPSYLNCSGANAPAECNNYVRSCGVNEVGCELYTSLKDNIGVAAKVLAQDYCPAECLGYDTYIQSETVFDSSRDSYFIPKTAKSCSASGAGCDQFTNLDEVARGGEGIEYYTYLRQCVKPSATDCAEFYTWEGSDESGFQLRVNSLKVNQATGEPEVTQDDSSACNETIYNLAATNPSYNTDCRQFYNRAGQISYHLYKRTISCDDNCHPYRRTALNIDPAITNAGGCGGADKHWDSALSQCIVCKNGGVWDDGHQACLYMAVPGQGLSCSAAENGCRQYTGNIGNNSMFIINNDFEGSGTTQGWNGISGTSVSLSNDSLVVSEHSLLVSGGSHAASTTVGQAVTNGKAYVLTFLAKAQTATRLSSIRLVNGSNQASDFSTANLTGAWNSYSVSLADLNHNVDDRESLLITGDGNFLLDDLRLTEIIDRYYLIKDSWATPESCDQDIEGNPSPLYMLGCEAYHDRDNATHNLHNFSFLCQDSAVGCELMIDTQNSTNYQSESFNAGATVVPADNFTYVVYDKNKQCNQNDKGCQLLGSPYQYANDVIYNPVYLKNDPDKYNKILCSANEVGCEEWFAQDWLNKDKPVDRSFYFKDPGDLACEWRQGAGLASNSWGWYLKKIKRCGGNGGTICQADKDCVAPATCKLETKDYSCLVNDNSHPKTFGYGGEGNLVNQPTVSATGNLAGLCPASQASCSEYLDPVSSFSSNLIFNSDFSQDVDNNGPDGWSNSSQQVTLDSYTLYRLAGKSLHEYTIKLDCPVSGSLAILTAENSLDNPINTINLPVKGGNIIYSNIFYNSSQQTCKFEVNGFAVGVGDYVELKKVIVDYQLSKELDKKTCNGIVDFEQGCVLFNERAQNGKVLAGLVWDADSTIDDGNGKPPSKGNLAQIDTTADANILLKVTPDRVCNKWLACRSYIKDEKGNNVCFDIGLCDSVDSNGYCSNYVITNKTNQIYPAPFDQSKINNAAGYAKAGYLASNSLNSDYYPLGAMKQVGEVANVANGGFEYAGSNGYPIGWYSPDGSWEANKFTVINNPIAAQNEGVGNAPEGNNFLKLGSTYSATSEFIDVLGSNLSGGIPYVLTVYLNTINLKVGKAQVTVEGFDSADNSLGGVNLIPAVVLDRGNGWTFKLSRFNIASSNITKIKVTVSSVNNPMGNYYIDDLKVMPALNSKQDWYTPQSCRLYPQTDSLSCDYYEDSGSRQKGSSGYCLEYDRYPGSSDACLLWYPIDKVKGEGIEEGAGYMGKFPVYYCDEAMVNIKEPTVPYNSHGPKNIYWANQTDHGDLSGGFVVDYPELVIPGGSYEIRNATGRGPKAAILENNADMLKISGGDDGCHNCFSEGSYSFDLYDSGTNEKVFHWEGNIDITLTIIFTKADVYCSKLVKTVNEIGQNKFWSSRVYSGSDFTFPCKALNVDSTSINFADTICAYDAKAAPFGSIAVFGDTVASIVNPYEWDGSQDAGIQPLYYLDLTSEPRVDWLHEEERIKRIFAQSYGTWQWNSANNRYEIIGGLAWGPPSTICAGNVRPCPPNDWCGVSPVINNIKVNNFANGNVELTKNQFINLTFNSYADSQQLPITMYAVNWGDGEQMVVSGVEMRNRPDSNNPFSLYHLYSYWDLKAKASVVSSINCSVAGQCSVKPSVQIKDDWGWYSGGNTINDSATWAFFAGNVTVYENASGNTGPTVPTTPFCGDKICSGSDTCGFCPTDCGSCSAVCAPPCTSTTCAVQGCGIIPDGCGSTLNCGACTPPQTCGGGGVPNVCGAGCTPTSCAVQGKNCDTISNGCGVTLTCGSCISPQTCKGGVCVSPVCGDFICNGSENCSSCLNDCRCQGSLSCVAGICACGSGQCWDSSASECIPSGPTPLPSDVSCGNTSVNACGQPSGIVGTNCTPTSSENPDGGNCILYPPAGAGVMCCVTNSVFSKTLPWCQVGHKWAVCDAPSNHLNYCDDIPW